MCGLRGMEPGIDEAMTAAAAKGLDWAELRPSSRRPTAGTLKPIDPQALINRQRSFQSTPRGGLFLVGNKS